MAFAIGIKVIKNKKDTDNLMIINVFCYFYRTVLPVKANNVIVYGKFGSDFCKLVSI